MTHIAGCLREWDLSSCMKYLLFTITPARALLLIATRNCGSSLVVRHLAYGADVKWWIISEAMIYCQWFNYREIAVFKLWLFKSKYKHFFYFSFKFIISNIILFLEQFVFLYIEIYAHVSAEARHVRESTRHGRYLRLGPLLRFIGARSRYM